MAKPVWRGRPRPRHLVLTLFLLALAAPAQPPRQSAAEHQLELTARQFVAAIKAGTTASVVAYLSPKGVVVDMDGERASLADIRKQFAGRTGLYCRWFDTDCLKREMADQSGGVFTQRTTEPRSYREILRLADKAEYSTSIDPDSPRQGEASVCLHGPQLSNDGAGYLLEFGFERTAAGWRLALEEGNFAGC
jgi:hypothetical protein